MLKTFKKAWLMVESPAGLVSAIFMVAIFLYSTFATSKDLERVDGRVTRSNEFQNTERSKMDEKFNGKLDKMDGKIDRIMELLLEQNSK